jgi:DNA-binding IclR family transcriptional regulator
MPEHEIQSVLAREIALRGDRADEIASIRAGVRAAGIGISIGQVNEGYAAVSAPVMNYDNRLAGSVTVLGPHSLVDRSPDGSVANAVRATAAKIALALGQQRPDEPQANVRSSRKPV